MTPQIESGGGVTRAAGLVGRFVWLCGLLLFGAIAAVAVGWLGVVARETHRADLPWLGLALAAGAVGVGFVVAVLRRPLRAHPLAAGLLAVALTRLAEVALVHTAPVSDFARYEGLARDILRHGFEFSTVPTGYPALLAALYVPFGANPVVGELANVAIALAIAWLLFDLARRLWGVPAATAAIWLYALSPAQALMTSVLATEGPYALLVLLAVWLTVRLLQVRPAAALALAAAVGLVLAASQYVRATTPAIVPAFVILPPLAVMQPEFVGSLRPRAALLAGVTIAVVFLVALAPIVAWNLQTTGELSITPSNYAGWSLLMGTNPASNGQYDASVLSQVPAPGGTPEFDRLAGQMALDRLRAHPLTFARLAVTKFPAMWGGEEYGVVFALEGSRPGPGAALLLLSQLAWAVVASLALGALWLVRRRPPAAVLLIVLIAAALAVLHTFAEVQSRYHSYLVPLFCDLAGYGLARLAGIVRGGVGQRVLGRPPGAAGSK